MEGWKSPLFMGLACVMEDEARNGAQVFHNSFPQTCLNFQSPPIKEEWIWQLDMVKL